MEAGFAKVCITPPTGTTMYGFAGRDRDHGCEKVHDNLFVRALYLSHQGEEMLILGFDLLFFSRSDADRYKGAVGRKLDLAPKRILLNTSHTHCGPVLGTTWSFADYDKGPDRLYADEVEKATVRAGCEARDNARDVTLWAGATRSSVPMSRRKGDEQGNIQFAPNPKGAVCDLLPFCLIKDTTGKPVCLLFSVSCHPSTIGGFEISADFPGPAMDMLDRELGATCSLFLQGCGGDAKASIIGQGDKWRGGTWDEVAQAGHTLAKEVLRGIGTGLARIEPKIRCGLVDMEWPLKPAMDRAGFEALGADAKTDEVRRLWAKRQLERLERGQKLATSVSITLHGVALGKGLRLIGLEGEAVAELGLFMLDFYKGKGTTFPLGYTDGAQLYLPTSAMLDEGGYEAVSAHEYGHPASLAKGVEAIILDGLKRLEAQGVR
ncbi:MAG: hypothetical protein A3K19_12240 [Lentisphaerae bacterium RIFOXYB12_FULL_65_16]|nr:MAG: hypothetical protein A3K18_28075 [Lentisphaerae bacterium RIFOXYA12_64_32]OGV86176.1 MAG: hypothetical protein A3K19_12240 [Lentisphaerae bacterium RIFOXYB12_FULL_65_16]